MNTSLFEKYELKQKRRYGLPLTNQAESTAPSIHIYISQEKYNINFYSCLFARRAKVHKIKYTDLTLLKRDHPNPQKIQNTTTKRSNNFFSKTVYYCLFPLLFELCKAFLTAILFIQFIF